MLFVYMYGVSRDHDGQELCLIAERPDQFSVPVRINALTETKSAVLRLGPTESARVFIDPQDGAKIIEPVIPTKLFLSPSLPDRPGVQVAAVKILQLGPQEYQVYYAQEKERGRRDNWKPFMANEVQF